MVLYIPGEQRIRRMRKRRVPYVMKEASNANSRPPTPLVVRLAENFASEIRRVPDDRIKGLAR